MELVGVHELAEELGVSRQRVHQLAQDPSFPDPLARLQAGSIWSKEAVMRWKRRARQTTGREPNVPVRDPDRPQDDPWDANAVRYLLGKPGGDAWTRGTLMEHLRGQPRLDPDRVVAARSHAAAHGVEVAAHAGGKVVHFFRSDADAPSPYPASEAERRRWRSEASA